MAQPLVWHADHRTAVRDRPPALWPARRTGYGLGGGRQPVPDLVQPGSAHVHAGGGVGAALPMGPAAGSGGPPAVPLAVRLRGRCGVGIVYPLLLRLPAGRTEPDRHSAPGDFRQTGSSAAAGRGMAVGTDWRSRLVCPLAAGAVAPGDGAARAAVACAVGQPPGAAGERCRDARRAAGRRDPAGRRVLALGDPQRGHFRPVHRRMPRAGGRHLPGSWELPGRLGFPPARAPGSSSPTCLCLWHSSISSRCWARRSTMCGTCFSPPARS